MSVNRHVLFFAALAFVSCAPTIKITKLNTVDSQRQYDGDITIYKDGQQVPHAYIPLGKLFVQKRGETVFNKPTDDTMIDLMENPTRKLGANGIVGFYSSLYCGEEPNSIRRWARGLAVRFVDSTTATGPIETHTVAVLPVVYQDSSLSVNEQLLYDTVITHTARYYLETAGYYTVLSTTNLIKHPADFWLVDKTILDTLGGSSSHLLFISLNDLSGANLGIMAGSGAEIVSYMFSKDVRDTVWVSSGSGGAVRLGLIASLIPGRDESAVYSAMKEVFDSLPAKNEDSH